MTCNDMMCDKWLNERQLLVGVLVNDHTLGCSVLTQSKRPQTCLSTIYT